MRHTRKKSYGMKRHMFLLPVLLVAVIALLLVAAAPDSWARGGKDRWHGEEVEFAEAAIFFEYNSTDQDLGLHIFFDAEAWKEVEVKNRRGEIFEVENGGKLSKIGSTEVFTESAEPPLCDKEDEEECTEEEIEDAIRKFQRKFPEGEYKFSGITVDGKRLRGEAELSWDLPAAPEIAEPEEDGEALDIAFINWEPGEDGPEIVGWEVVAELVFEVDDEEKVYVNTATLPAGVTSFTVSEEFVRIAVRAEAAGVLVELKAEVIAIAENGNKTITEVVVFEAPEQE